MPKVLLLEDDRDMNMLLRTLLEIEGYQVLPYQADQPALPQVESLLPDLLLLDVHLGGQDGLQILREIRQKPALRDVRIVMTSGINLTEECLHAGANAFIVKPYMPENLLRILKEVLATPPDQVIPSETPKAPPASSYPKVF
jgi:CheY-like chemotaxis protein